MPTKLTKPVRREVSANEVTAALVVELCADGVRVREKRHRRAVLVPFAALMAYTPGPAPLTVETKYWTLCVRVHAHGVEYREPHARKSFTIPHGVAFQRAVTLTVAADRADAKATRKRVGKHPARPRFR